MFANFSLWQKPRLRRRGCRLVVVKRAGTASLLLAGALSAQHTHADTINWLGTVSSFFDVAANWSANRVPTAGDTAYINAATVRINGITINPDVIDLNNGSFLDLQNSPTLNVASILFTNTNSSTTASNLYFEGVTGSTAVYTLGSGVTLSGRIGGIGNNTYFNNTGSTLNTAATINANVSGNTTVLGGNGNYVTTFNNSGSITASNGNNLTINATNYSNSGGNLTVSGGALNFNGNNFTNASGSNLTVSSGGTLRFNGNNVSNASGATLNVTDTSLLNLNGAILTSNGTATISNLAGSGTLTGSSAYTIGNINLNNGDILFLNGANVSANTINLNNGSNLDVRGNTNLNSSPLIFGNTAGNTNPSYLYFEGVAGSTAVYTLGSGVTLSGRIGGIGGDASFVNNNASTLNTAATINANVSGNTTTLGSGNYVTTLNNSGSITASNGNNLNLNARTFTNSGTLTVASGSAATVTSNIFMQTGSASKTIVNGTVTNANIFTVQGGTVEGTGTITGSLSNTGGTVTAGGDTTAGHLSLNGNYTQGTSGIELVKLGGTGQGTSYDLFSVANAATLHGTLDVQLLNGFTPFVGETFDFLTYHNRVGLFDNIVAVNNPYTYTVTYNDAAGIGTLSVGPAVVPEAGTVVTLSLLLCGAGCVAREKRKKEKGERKKPVLCIGIYISLRTVLYEIERIRLRTSTRSLDERTIRHFSSRMRLSN